MNKYCLGLLLTVILFLSACSTNQENDAHAVSLHEIENIHIGHGSTTLIVESADIESLEAFWINSSGPEIVVDKKKDNIKIRLKSDIRNIIHIGKMPQLSVRIPNSYKKKVTIDGSSGNVKIVNLSTQNLNVKGSSGNVSLDYLKINSDINISLKSGNVLLNLEDKDSNVDWLLQSGSGRRSVSIPLNNPQRSNRKTQGQTGDGLYNVHLQTTSGNITVK